MNAFQPSFVKYDLGELYFIGNHRSRNEKLWHLKTFNFIETVAGLCSFVFTEEQIQEIGVVDYSVLTSAARKHSVR